MIPIALTIAGSDSSGGAGIQADLKTFSALGVYGASAITAVTAQNTRGVQSVCPVPAEMIRAQIEQLPRPAASVCPEATPPLLALEEIDGVLPADHRMPYDVCEIAFRVVDRKGWLEFMADGGYKQPTLWLSDGWHAVQSDGWETPLYWRATPDGWVRHTLENRLLALGYMLGVSPQTLAARYRQKC